MADDVHHAHGRTYRTPRRVIGIHPDEEIAGENRRLDGIDAPGMAPALAVTGQVGKEALIAQMRKGLLFGIGAGVNDEPAHGQPASRAGGVLIRSTSSGRMRSASSRAARWS